MSKTQTIIGIDLGGTKIHAGLYRARDMKLLKDKKIPTQANLGLKIVLEKIASLIDELKDAGTKAVGIGIPGYLNPKTGEVFKTPNIPGRAVNLRTFFSKMTALPVVFDNDANLFTLAEHELNHKKAKHMIGITMGTGLGGGIIIDGALYRGRDGFAGEFGHVAFDRENELEDLASGKGPKETLGRNVGITLANLIHIFNPDLIVMGGSVTKEFDRFKKDMLKEIKKRTLPQSTKDLDIHVSKLKHAGTLGAAFLALKSLKNA